MAPAAALALALGWSSSASAQEGPAYDVLNGLVDGFTGAAGSDLWGWMMGGGQSAGIGAISSELDTIENTLSAIEAELGPNGAIAKAIEQLTCSTDSDWIEAGPATTIGTWYEVYSDFLTDYQSNIDIPLGEIASTNMDVTTQYGWANGVIQGNANQAPQSVLDAMIELKNLSLTTSTAGTIAECIKTAGNVPAANTLDDRPYYNNNVQGLSNYLLVLNTQAMIMLTEAYHIYAFGDCVTSNGGSSTNIPEACKSSSGATSSEIITNLCPTTGTQSENCGQPITIYGSLATSSRPATGQFLPFTYAQFQAAGAPYSTGFYVMQNGTDYMLSTSIEGYTQADPGNDCGDGVLTSLLPCGVAVGPYNAPLQSIAYGPHGYGADGYGTWTTAPESLFASLGSPTAGGVGLANLTTKIILFDKVAVTDVANSGYLIESLVCFVAGGISPKPFCAGNSNQWPAQIAVWIEDGTDPDGCFIYIISTAVTNKSSNPGFFKAIWCHDPPKGWVLNPGYTVQHAENQYRWPALSLATLTCSDGSSAADAKNPAGMPTMCGKDFDVWFNARVPSGPTTLTASADATAYRGDRNRNDGAGTQLVLGGKSPQRGAKRVVAAFDREAVQAFLDAGPLASARLVLTSADGSQGGRDHWVAAFPLHAGFVEGNGEAATGNRGTDTGVTWNCAEDADISDHRKACLQDWPRPLVDRRNGTLVVQEDGYAGPVSWDVTKHVEGGFHAWLLRRLGGGGGSLSYTSREGAAEMDDPLLAPTLILVRATEESLVAEADPAEEDAGAE